MKSHELPAHELENLKRFLSNTILEQKFLHGPTVPIIGIDGAAAVGKGTVMRNLRELGYRTFTNGEMFRALAWCFVKMGYSGSDRDFELFCNQLSEITITIEPSEGKMFLRVTCSTASALLDPESEDTAFGLRSSQVSGVVSKISELPVAIERVNHYLRQSIAKAMEEKSPFSFEGRDNYETFNRETMPDDPFLGAMILLYLAANEETLDKRAITRDASLRQKKGQPPATPEEVEIVKQNNHRRNLYDMTRKNGRLLSYQEALEMKARGRYDEVIDTTNMTPEEVFLQVCKLQLLKLLEDKQN